VKALAREVEAIASATGFSGIVRIDESGELVLIHSCGLADRAHGVPVAEDTQFAIASGVKGFTAAVVASLIADGLLNLESRVRSWLQDDLPLIGDGVTVEHLLAHRSGIGDYIDEEADHETNDYVLSVPVHELASTEQYLAVLGGHPAKFAPGERFVYCNSGYVVLALLAERATGRPFDELVRTRICEPAGMADTEFLRSDALPGRAALGYLDESGLRTNVFHLPVRGSGDGGIYSTSEDLSRFWPAFFGGKLVPADWVAELVRPRSEVPRMRSRYGLGFWLDAVSDAVFLEGSDAGVSFRSVHDPAADRTYTVISNSSGGAWPLVRLLDERLRKG
jgi:CubicO group peptidase (beta-lactamase class C family)